MQAGKLDRRVSIDYPVATQDPVYGTETITWERLVLGWAEVQDALPSRSEAVTQGLSVARNQTRLRMRWRGDIDSSMRVIVHGDEDVTYSIVGGPAEIGGRKRMVELVLEKYSS